MYKCGKWDFIKNTYMQGWSIDKKIIPKLLEIKF